MTGARRLGFLLIIAATLLLQTTPKVQVSEDPELGGRVETAIRKAIRFLLSRQQPGVGAYGTQNRLAITSMASLALMSRGSTPTRGPHSESILQALRWVLATQNPRGGQFEDASNGYSGIHNHGYALTFLSQAYGECGLELDERIGRAIRHGIRATKESQHPNGGFGYFIRKQVPPNNEMYTGDEASTTISQLQALRGARSTGFEIPADLIASAERYIARSQHKPTGGFIYSLKNGRVSFKEGSDRPTFEITAASACVLNALGTYRGPNLDRAIEYMEAFRPDLPKKDVFFFYYGHYYAAQIMHQLGGERSRRWRAAIIRELLRRQESDGSFPKVNDSHVPGEDGAILNTAWCVQIMTMENGVLPMFER